jgi:presenilin-like A22 family membrane protease
MFYGALTAYGLAAFAFFALLYEQKRADTRERWYLAVLPPALFILLYLVYNGTTLWFPYLLNTYGVIFAVLVTLYLGSLFTWKNLFIFAGLLTVMDIVLVLFTGVMVTAAKQVAGLGLPVLISLPTIPLIVTEEWGVQYMSLGLGDFFFAGILATQTYKKFGKRTAVLSALTMSLSFAIFEAFLLNYQWGAFPGTLMIICGWLPVVAWKLFAERKTNNNRVGIESKIGC